ncbi:hypothetical protein FRC01_014898, partial [Tulasnella sp. 417]
GHHHEPKFNLQSRTDMMNRSISAPTSLKHSKLKRMMLGRDPRWGCCLMQRDLWANRHHQGPKANDCYEESARASTLCR